jgi:hypothetical protein
MPIKYNYQMDGEAAAGQSWITNGIIELPTPGEFVRLSELALRDSFQKLTNNKAVYGKPGLGCVGPYKIRKLVLELVDG